MDSAVALKVEKLSCSPVLHDISFSVARGEVFGVIGPNGAGKTTLFKSLLGISGLRNRTYRKLFLRARVGYLPEQVVFPGHLTVRDVFSIVQSAIQGPTELLALGRKMVPIQVPENRLVHACSKGEKRKIALHLALLSGPEILFLDEPSDGLDVMSRLQLRAFIHEISRMGITVVLCSHVLTELETMTHRGVILRNGRIAATYPREDDGEETEYVITCASDVTQVAGPWHHPDASVTVDPDGRQLVVREREWLGPVVEALARQDMLLRVERSHRSLEDLFVRLCHD